MKKFIFAIIGLVLISGVMISQAQTSSTPKEVVVGTNPDSLINVIGYFCKNDTIDYWISESEWKFNDGDTIKTAGVSSKVRIVVTDSTSTGYKMTYTFLDCVGDTAVATGLGAFQNKIVEKLGQKVVGTTIEFETNEFGHITKFNNLNKIKKQAKSLYKDCMNELVNVDEIKALKDMGIDMKKLINQNVNTDELVDGYTKELNMLFACHGNSYPLGENHTHEDATETQYENDTYVTVYKDSDDDYHLSFDVVSIIPQSVIKDKVGELVGMFVNNDIIKDFAAEYDKQVNVDATSDSYLEYNFISNGWPYKVLDQTTNMIGKVGKCKQTYIWIDHYSFSNWAK
jgi:Fe-S cluster assembly iron-binding protein IscA